MIIILMLCGIRAQFDQNYPKHVLINGQPQDFTIPFCQIHSTQKNVCRQCKQNYFYSPPTKICEPCSNNCTDQCIYSESNCNLDQIKTLPDQITFDNYYLCTGLNYIINCSQCRQQFYPAHYNGIQVCQKCRFPCRTCTGDQFDNCISCQMHFLLHQNKCLANCHDGYFKFDGTCKKCQNLCKKCSEQNCHQCVQGNYLNINICLPCKQGSEICQHLEVSITCKDSYMKQYHNDQNIQCVQICSQGFYQIINACQKCSHNCLKCTSIQCLECALLASNQKQKYKKENTQCLQHCPITHIENTTFLQDIKTPICQLCSNYFANCKVCDLSGCIQCLQTHKKLIHNSNTTQCVQSCTIFREVNNECIQCQIFHGNKNNSCQSCSLKNCNQCNWDNQGQKCYECQLGYSFNGKICQKDRCQVGFYFDSPNCKFCESVIQNCFICKYDQDVICQQCQYNHRIQNNGCIQNDCQAGTYYHQILQQCKNCYPGCSKCYGPSQYSCTQCQSGKRMNNSICIQSCQPFEFSKNGKFCCHHSCRTCIVQNKCFECDVNKNRILNQTTKLCDCMIGYIEEWGISQSSLKAVSLCQPYDPFCLQLQYPCSKCIQGFLLFEKKRCLKQCPTGYAKNTKSQCFQCKNCFNLEFQLQSTVIDYKLYLKIKFNKQLQKITRTLSQIIEIQYFPLQLEDVTAEQVFKNQSVQNSKTQWLFEILPSKSFRELNILVFIKQRGQFKGYDQIILQQNQAYITVHNFLYYSTENFKSALTTKGTSQAVAKLISQIIIPFIIFGEDIFFGVILLGQLIYFHNLINLNIPLNAYKAAQGFQQMSTVGFGFQFPLPIDQRATNFIPQRLAKKNLTADFFYNSINGSVQLLLLTLASFLLVKLIQYFIKYQKLLGIFIKIQKSFKWSRINQAIEANYLALLLHCLMQICYRKADTDGQIIRKVFVVLIYIFFVTAPFVVFVKIWRERHNMQTRQMKSSFQCFYQNISPYKKYGLGMFLAWYFLKILLTFLIVVVDIPRAGMYMLLSYTSVIFLLVLIYNPYKRRYDQIRSLSFGGTIIIYQLGLIRVIKIQPSDESELNLQYGNSIINLILLVMSVHFVISFIQIGRGIYQVQMIKKKIKQLCCCFFQHPIQKQKLTDSN